MTEGATQTAAGSGAAIAVVRAPAELDLATADGLAARGCAIAGYAGLLLLDLTSLSFCDARGLSAFVRIANQADRAGCRLALIAPQPPVAKVLRICRLDQRLPVFATTGHALDRRFVVGVCREEALYRRVIWPGGELDLEKRAALELDAWPESADREEEHAGDDEQRREQEIPPLALDKMEEHR